MHKMSTAHCTTEEVNPVYLNAHRQLYQWQNLTRLCEMSHVEPEQDFTQVTNAAYPRKNSRHRCTGITQHYVDAERERSHLVQSPAYNKGDQQETHNNDPNIRFYNCQAKATNAIDRSQNMSTMFCGTCPYLFRPQQHHSHWCACPVTDRIHAFDIEEACGSLADCFGPSLDAGLPPTPADTVEADEGPQKYSSTNSIASPWGPTLGPTLNGTASYLGTLQPSEADNSVHEQQGFGSLLSPPPDRIHRSQERIYQLLSGQPQYAYPGTNIKLDDFVDSKQDDEHTSVLSPITGIQDDPDLDFLLNDWDPHNIDFLEDAGKLAPVSVSDQPSGGYEGQENMPSTDLPSGLESAFPSDTEVRSTNFQAYSSFAPDAPSHYQFDESGGYLPIQNNLSGAESFQPSFPLLEPHHSPLPPDAASRANERTGYRRKTKDQLLVDLKRRGFSYKDIKAMGQFEEAESTLRGRHRTLTKPKEARVRKPGWGDWEVALLLQAVAAHTNSYELSNTMDPVTMSRSASKIPWKQVAEYMASRGAYKYGNATVKKKWMEVTGLVQDG